jgi:CubicO group peptidase (beta-lactamase class C family)
MALLFRSLLFALSAMLATCTTTTDSSAATPSDAVDNYIVEQMKKDNIPGLALAVVKGAKLSKPKATAWRILNSKSRPLPTRFLRLVQ